MTEAATKSLPVTVSIKPVLPAAALDGESAVIDGTGLEASMVKVSAPDVPPPGAGVTTVMPALPAVAMSVADTCAVSSVSLTKVVVSGVPFQLIADAATKSLPVTVRVKAGLPEATLDGDSALIEGTGFDALMESVSAPEVPPPGAGVTTVMLAVPAFK